jgi:hypothetical protein
MVLVDERRNDPIMTKKKPAQEVQAADKEEM